MLTAQQLQELNELLPRKTHTDTETLGKHAGNQFYTQSHLPDAVCYAESDDDVITVVNFCIKHRIPVIPFGSGTSVEGHITPIHGGISLNLSRMNKVLEVNLADGYVTVQPGISYNQLNEQLQAHNVHFPVEAGWGASIGGMVSTNASGAGAVDSGSMAKNILSCHVVTYKNGSAEKIKLGSKSVKSSAGYHLLDLMVGSEGTLGVITEVVLKIKKNTPAHRTVCAQFNDMESAINFVIAMKGIIPFKRAELLDHLQTTACVKHSNFSQMYCDKITVMMELAGVESVLQHEVEFINAYLNKVKVELIKIYQDKDAAAPVWAMRKQACPAAIAYLGTNKKAMATDISVPLSKLNVCINKCYMHMKALGIVAPLVAHAGDGNFHFTLLVDPTDQQQLNAAKEFNSRIVSLAIQLDGTCTGEHGIGVGKQDALREEHGDSLFLMQGIKSVFDPLNIFNPGKVLKISNSLTQEKALEGAYSVRAVESTHF